MSKNSSEKDKVASKTAKSGQQVLTAVPPNKAVESTESSQAQNPIPQDDQSI